MKLFKILFFLLFLFSCIYCKQNAEVNTTRPMEYHIDYSKIRVIAVLPSNEKRQIDIYGICKKKAYIIKLWSNLFFF